MNNWLKKNKTLIAALVAAISVICGSISLADRWDDVYLAVGLMTKADNGDFVRFADVGQGDCTVVQSGGRAMLIDVGDKAHAAQVYNYLRSLGIRELDCVIVTHPHSDHMGGLEYLCEHMSVGSVYITERPPSEKSDLIAYESVLSKTDYDVCPTETLNDFEFGDFNVSVAYFDSSAYDENDRSAVIYLVCGGYSFLITGDITSAAEQKINTSADVLKVAHHGSKNSSSDAFLKRVAPHFAVISVGADNSYGHPNRSTLDRLNEIGAVVRRTDVNGAVTFEIDNGLKLYTEY